MLKRIEQTWAAKVMGALVLKGCLKRNRARIGGGAREALLPSVLSGSLFSLWCSCNVVMDAP